jgi:hypothetical protein
MANEKTESLEETKWWIDRGPVKEREKSTVAVRGGIIEKWAYELLKGYNQDHAMKNLVDINPKLLKELSVGHGEWGYFSMEVGSYPPERLAKIKNGLPLPPSTWGVQPQPPADSPACPRDAGELKIDSCLSTAPLLQFGQVIFSVLVKTIRSKFWLQERQLYS